MIYTFSSILYLTYLLIFACYIMSKIFFIVKNTELNRIWAGHRKMDPFLLYIVNKLVCSTTEKPKFSVSLQKGGVPAAPSGTATLLRLSPNYQFYPRALLAVTHFRYPRLSWLDGRCVQGPGTYSPRRG